MATRLSKEIFIERAEAKYGKKFDYSEVIYITLLTKVWITCLIHKYRFEMTPDCHLASETGCPQCGKELQKKNISKSQDEFIAESTKIYGDLFSYSNVEYINGDLDVEIFCNKHNHLFKVKPHWFLLGRNCPDCGKERGSLATRYTIDIFIEKANLKHNNKYDYSESIYIDSVTKLKIKCRAHGYFNQYPRDHLRGKGCPKCPHTISKPEKEWLNSLNIPEEWRQKKIKVSSRRVLKPDALDEENKICYEFYGSFFHGDPAVYDSLDINKNRKQTFGELYNKTIERENLLKSLGYKIISIWESEWIKNK